MANPNGTGGFTAGHKLSIGRPKGSKNKFNKDAYKNILNALSIVEKNKVISKGKNFWVHIAERAYKSDIVAIALLKKFCPDLASTEHGFGEDKMVKVKFELVEADKAKKKDLVTTPKKTLEELER